jgi:hypothetical protein
MQHLYMFFKVDGLIRQALDAVELPLATVGLADHQLFDQGSGGGWNS